MSIPSTQATNPAERRDAIQIRLTGGPRDLPAEVRVRSAAVDQSIVKVEHLGGYDHFERTDERSADGLVVFR